MQIRYADAGQSSVVVTLAEGDNLGSFAGPTTIALSWPSPGNPEHDALAESIEAGALTVAAFAPPPPAVPDTPTLSDWRVGLTLWKRPDGTLRIDEVTKKVADLVTAGHPLGRIARERLEYANNVLRDQLMQLTDALGFTEPEIDESLWRADRVRQGDLSGQWPLPAGGA